jgi:hypothetical protein
LLRRRFRFAAKSQTYFEPRRLAKTLPIASTGFEIETELSVHALDLKITTAEVLLGYTARRIVHAAIEADANVERPWLTTKPASVSLCRLSRGPHPVRRIRL